MSQSFADLGVPDDLVATLSRQGIESPFPIQVATITDALAGRDVSGRAPTGSGKTLAFGIPLIARLGKAEPRRPRALILAPTRELAAQIERELIPLAKTRQRFVTSVYGGVGYEPQRRALNRGVDVLVACPGRLEDLIETRHVRLDAVQFVVVDEADRMADMGFLPPVRRILDQCTPNRQTLLFSATLDGAIGELTKRYQRDPAVHDVGAAEADGREAHHVFWKVRQTDRSELTAKVAAKAGSVIVFTRTRHGADRLVKQLDRQGVQSIAIHGGRSQAQRDRALASFTKGQVNVLIATDVAARGIHVDSVSLVIHFDAPADEKDYLHRSGRTARAGADGVVLSYVPPDGEKKSRALRRDAGIEAELTMPDVDALLFALPAVPARVTRAECSDRHEAHNQEPDSHARRRPARGRPDPERSPRQHGDGKPSGNGARSTNRAGGRPQGAGRARPERAPGSGRPNRTGAKPGGSKQGAKQGAKPTGQERNGRSGRPTGGAGRTRG